MARQLPTICRTWRALPKPMTAMCTPTVSSPILRRLSTGASICRPARTRARDLPAPRHDANRRRRLAARGGEVRAFHAAALALVGALPLAPATWPNDRSCDRTVLSPKTRTIDGR